MRLLVAVKRIYYTITIVFYSDKLDNWLCFILCISWLKQLPINWLYFELWIMLDFNQQVQEWHIGENPCLPPRWPRFDIRLIVILYVGWLCCFSTLHWEVFSQGSLVFPSPQKPICHLNYWFAFIVNFSRHCLQLVLQR